MKRIITTILFALLPAHALAAYGLGDLENQLNQASQTGDQKQLVQNVYSAVAAFLKERVFSFLISVAIALAVLFILYGAMQYFTAYGDENKATNAKKTLAYAFLGLIIAFMSMGIASLVQRQVIFDTANNPQVSQPQAPVEVR